MRYLFLLKKIILANFGFLKKPYKLIFSITKECHSRCQNCNIWKTKAIDELSLEEIKTIAKNASYLSWLNITGGEPTDRKDFVDIIATFIENCPDLAVINFPTNGINTRRIISVCQKLCELNLPKMVVIVSIDGPPEVNDQIRGIKNDFVFAVQTFKELKKLPRISPLIGMTLYDENHHLIDATIAAIQELVIDFKPRDLHLNIRSNSGHFYNNLDKSYDNNLAVATSIETFMFKYRRLSLNPISFFERAYQSRVRQYLLTGKTPIDCAALNSSIYLSESGEVFPCTIWSETLGNIRNQQYSLERIYENQNRINSLRRTILEKKCPNCWSPCEASQSIMAQLVK